MGTFYSPPIIHDGMTFCLDGKNLKCYSGSGTSVTNLAAKANNGTLTNSPTFNTNGYWTFDGSNDYIDCGGYLATGALNSHGNMTFEAWYYQTAYNTSAAIIGYYGDVAAGTRRGMVIWNGAGAGSFKIRMSTNGYNSYGNTTAPLNAWTHAVITFGTDGSNKIYLNGVLDGSPADVTMNTPTGTAPIKIGKSETGEYFQGNIAVGRIYNRRLTDSEVLQNFNALRRRFGV